METYFHLKNNLTYRLNKNQLGECTCLEALRFLKGIYTSIERFQERYLNDIASIPELYKLHTYLSNNYDSVEAFSFKEALQIESLGFKRMVFDSINITEMIQNLGATRLQVTGKEVTRKQYDHFGKSLPEINYHAIYETYTIDGRLLELKLDINLFAVKCWCTSTNKEHWLWIEDEYKDDPLAAIASTFRFHENVIPHIKELKRQGDIMLVEMKTEVNPKGKIIPLTADQYFNLLTAES
ncbi:hypothetical protein [Flavobacterium sp. ACAM 123]|jgi:hypothetical protein|uniref:hypothetical protein n=1 Tax=Flavobacterium sp. ACAM 123 TaxID=1189620 RepID=UPI0002D57786|nr:hypothetical protein [Flavobacterium sp. ACAM 123]